MKKLVHIGGLLFVLLLLLGVADSDTSHVSISLPNEIQTKSVSYFQQKDAPYEETKDYLFNNGLIDLPQPAITPDFQFHSKFKCLMRLLTYINEQQKQTSRKKSSLYHTSDACHPDVDYYIYALRRILI